MWRANAPPQILHPDSIGVQNDIFVPINVIQDHWKEYEFLASLVPSPGF
mgnify:FL=1